MTRPQLMHVNSVMTKMRNEVDAENKARTARGMPTINIQDNEHYNTLQGLLGRFVIGYHQQASLTKRNVMEHGQNGLFTTMQTKQLQMQVYALQALRKGQELNSLQLQTVKEGFGGAHVPPGMQGILPLVNHPRMPYDYNRKPISMGMVVAVPHGSEPKKLQPPIHRNGAFLAQEWDRQIERRMSLEEARLKELKAQGKLDIKGQIKLKQLKLADVQHNLRVSVLNAMDDTRPSLVLDRALKKKRKAEEHARNMFHSSIKDRGKELHRFWKEFRKDYDKNVVNGILKYHRRGANDEERQERERIRALKEHDEEAYLELIKQTKNERILNLIRETDAFMAKLGAKVLEEKKSQGAVITVESDMAPVPDEVTGDDACIVETMKKNKNKYYEVTTGVVEDVTVQPEMLVAGQMRPYQMKGLEWMVSLFNNKLNGILADEMGLGKTLQTISLLCYLMEQKNINGPFLCIVPLSTLHNNWAAEFQRWAPAIDVLIYEGNKNERKLLRKNRLVGTKFNVMITTFENAMFDRTYLKPVLWEYIIVDEAHRLKNPKSRLASDLADHYQSKRRLALTGTPLQNNLEEVWALLTFLHPNIFGTMTNFEQWFAAPFAKGGDKVETNEEEKLLIIDRLHKVLRPFILRREKNQVEKEMPDKKEFVVKVRMSALQARLYEYVEKYKKNPFADVPLHNLTMQLRKIANHPFLMMNSYFPHHLARASGKVELLDRILPKLRKAGHRVLMFSQMTEMISILCEYFDTCDFKYLKLIGDTDTADRSAAVNAFNDPNSDYFLFILSTKAGGMGLNLQTADTVILFDSDWNPQGDEQAKARAHRIGQKKEVIVLRLLSEKSVEEKMLATAKDKLENEAMVIQAGMFHEGHDADERRRMTMHLIKEGNDEEYEMDDELMELNSRLARDQEEAGLYNKWDRESILEVENRTAKEWLDSRLLNDVELNTQYPQLRAANEESERLAALAAAGPAVESLGRRKRKEVKYDDGDMDEAKWLKQNNLMMPGFSAEDALRVETEEHEQRSRKKQRLGSGSKPGGSKPKTYDEGDLDGFSDLEDDLMEFA